MYENMKNFNRIALLTCLEKLVDKEMTSLNPTLTPIYIDAIVEMTATKEDGSILLSSLQEDEYEAFCQVLADSVLDIPFPNIWKEEDTRVMVNNLVYSIDTNRGVYSEKEDHDR